MAATNSCRIGRTSCARSASRPLTATRPDTDYRAGKLRVRGGVAGCGRGRRAGGTLWGVGRADGPPQGAGDVAGECV